MDSFKLPQFEKPGSNPKTESKTGSNNPNLDQFQGRAEKIEIQQFIKKKEVAAPKKDYADFSSNKFMSEGTLLTNIEDYSNQIKVDADQHAHKVREEVDLLKSEFELELANALIKRVESEEEAARIIKNAEDSRDEIVKKGNQEGYQAGLEEGSKIFKAENIKNTSHIIELLKEIKGLKTSLLQKNEQDFVKLALLFAEKVVHKNLQSDQALVLEMIKNNINRFEGMGNITIRLNPVEYDFIALYQGELQSFLDEEQVLRIKVDPDIKPAAPIIESDFTAIDLDIKKQFKKIETYLDNIVEDRQILFKEKK